MTSKSNF